jgi:signal transduction histidine kinase
MTASSTDDLASAERRIQELTKELSEAREQQAATAEILRVISSSPTDQQRVFEEIATSAARLCDAYDATIFQVDGDLLRLVAHHGSIPQDDTLPLTREVVTGRAVLDRRTVHVADMQAEADEFPDGSSRARHLGHRTILAVPLMRVDEAIGVIAIRRTEVRPFTDRQIELLKTFADQAVIAIENTRLFNETQEALARQTASADILRVISHSPTDVTPVFDAIVEAAVRLLVSDSAFVLRTDGKTATTVAAATPAGRLGTLPPSIPVDPDHNFPSRAILSRSMLHLPDWSTLSLPPHEKDVYDRFGLRSALFLPLVRGGECLGVLVFGRGHPREFTAKEIALAESFRDQAVIAIENARLFEAEQASKRELTESLEQQTATADVLKVISRSALDVQKVLDALVESAARLCNAYDAVIFQVFGDGLRLAAHHGQIPMAGPIGQLTLSLVRGRIIGRAVIDRRTIQVTDALAEPNEYPESHKTALQLGYRTVLAVPLVHTGKAIGVILIRRGEVRLFTERQIELVNTFADQAVIAIENTRLFEAEQTRTKELQSRSVELAQSLEYQTAISDVLGIINRSKFDLKPVLDAIARVASNLCANDVMIQLRDGEELRAAAHHGSLLVHLDSRRPIGRDWVSGRAVVDRKPIHVSDLASAGDEFPLGRDLARQFGHRTTLAIPLLREEEAVGCLLLRRLVVEPFSEKQILLLQTFADQAVIAIENTRLFEEIAQKSRELEIASQHKNQFVANMSHELRTPLAAILGYAELIQEGFYEQQGPKSLEALTRIRSNGKHLLGLINTVLDIAKIESGQFTLNMTEYAIESVVETVRAATESLAQSKKLTLKTTVAKSLPVGLGDEQRLTQVLLNLVGNAIKFTDAGEVSIAAGARNGHFSVSVTDTGPGIPLDQQDRIFDQFHQVDSSLTKAKGGTGLGLAIAKQIVEMHGGRIWVVSTPGKGSTFQMELPTRAEPRKTTLP